MEKISPKAKILIFILVIVAIMAVFAVALWPKTTLSFRIAPGVLDVSIDGKEKQQVKLDDKIKIAAGEHSLAFSKDGFAPYTAKVTVKSYQDTSIVVALKAFTLEASEQLTDETSQTIIQAFNGPSVQKGMDQVIKDYPIISVLPIDARLYTVYPCASKVTPDDRSKYAICVDLYQKGLETYVDKDVKSRGYNLADYEVIYIQKY